LYDKEFWNRCIKYYNSDYQILAKAIYDEFKPSTAVELGCGIGMLMKPLTELGVHIIGIDNSNEAKENFLLDETKFIKQDLKKDINYFFTDLTLCIEVAEHIDEKYAERLILHCSRFSKTVVFTAAQPRQNGLNHINCQHKEYWIGLFNKYGFIYDHDTTVKLRNKLKLKNAWYIPKNIMILRRAA